TIKPGWTPATGLVGAPLLGIVFGLGWTPCLGPTLAAINLLSVQSGSAWQVLGEKWTLMIVRDALAGATRFSQFQQSLGIPREVLTARLGSLVEGGVLERHAYKPDGGRVRDEYV
ncbi:winged helix-turn-helix transcriptional regulator, partial [Curtobacterium sp. B18]|uniref:winged helix-turn-helix transcriptional regulator n=1 Tax=Curtobacterium sp. B18 TaxID=95614 RepID=UPI0003B5B2A7